MARGVALVMHKSSTKNDKNQKIKHIIDLLKFALTLDDEEIIRSTIETIIEQLEDISK